MDNIKEQRPEIKKVPSLKNIDRTPDGYYRCIVALKSPELKKLRSMTETPHIEIDGKFNIDELIDSMENLNEKVKDVIEAGETVYNICDSQCCSGSSWKDCFKNLCNPKTKIKTGDNKMSAI